jgi:hypothetical protein
VHYPFTANSVKTMSGSFCKASSEGSIFACVAVLFGQARNAEGSNIVAQRIIFALMCYFVLSKKRHKFHMNGFTRNSPRFV